MDLDGANAEDVVTVAGIVVPLSVALGPTLPDDIPAVSGWGMVTMTLLMIVVATLGFARRRLIALRRYVGLF